MSRSSENPNTDWATATPDKAITPPSQHTQNKGKPMLKPDIIQISQPAARRHEHQQSHPNRRQSLISARFSLLPAEPARRRQQRRHTRLRTRRNTRLHRRHRLCPRTTPRSRTVRIGRFLLRRLCRHLRRPRARTGFVAAYRRGSTPLHRPPRTFSRP